MYFECSFFEPVYMKNSKQQTAIQKIKLSNNQHRPENKNNIDNREREQQLNKGDDRTHNRKERKNFKKKHQQINEQIYNRVISKINF